MFSIGAAPLPFTPASQVQRLALKRAAPKPTKASAKKGAASETRLGPGARLVTLAAPASDVLVAVGVTSLEHFAPARAPARRRLRGNAVAP
jgi:hypothetical protein